MSRRGEAEGFEPHPGDPWHPQWSDDSAPAPSGEHGDGEEAVEKPRGRRHGRRRSRSEEVPDLASIDEAEEAEAAEGLGSQEQEQETRRRRRGLFGRRSDEVSEPDEHVEAVEPGEWPAEEDRLLGLLDEAVLPGAVPSDDDLAALIAQLADAEPGEPPLLGPGEPNGGELETLLPADDTGLAGSSEADAAEAPSIGEIPDLAELADDEVAAEGDIEEWIAFIEEPAVTDEPARRRFGLGRRRGERSEQAESEGLGEGAIEWGVGEPGVDGSPEAAGDFAEASLSLEDAGAEIGGQDEPEEAAADPSGVELPTLDELFPDSAAAAAPALPAESAEIEDEGEGVGGEVEPEVPATPPSYLDETVPGSPIEAATEWGFETAVSASEPAGADQAAEAGSLEAADALLDDLFEPPAGPPETIEPTTRESVPTAAREISPPVEPPPAAEEIVEDGEWSGDRGTLPRSWFAEIDEDRVEPPPGDLPEVEWEAEEDETGAAVRGRERETPAVSSPAVTMPAPAAQQTAEANVVPPEAVDPSEPASLEQVAGAAAPTEERGPSEADEARGFDPMSLIGASAEVDDTSAESAEEVPPGGPEPTSGPAAGEWVEFVEETEEQPDQEAALRGPGDRPEFGQAADDDTAGWGHSDRESGDFDDALDEELPPPPPFDPESLLGLTPGVGEAWEPGETDDAEPPPGTEEPVSPGIGSDEFDPMVLVERLDRRPVGPPFDHEDPTLEYEAPVAASFEEQIYAGAGTVEHRDLADEIARAGTGETELQALSAPMEGVLGGVVGFEDVEDLGTGEDYVARPRSDLGLRVVTGLVLVSLLLGSLFVGGEALAIFIGLVVLTGLVEFYGTLRARGFHPQTLFGLLAGAGMLVGTWFHGPVAIPGAILALAVVVFFFSALAPGRRDALANGGLTVLGVTWVTGTAAFAYPIVGVPEFRTLVMALVVSTVAMDVGAYFFGRTWGSSPLAPILSPNKSIEGLAGGVVAAVVAAVLVGRFFDPLTIRIGAWLGLVVAVLAPIGDLAESMVKRSLGVKDMGSILPGHGGILDRIDAFLFVLPAAWVLYTATGLLG